jgi:hypothetical protein
MNAHTPIFADPRQARTLVDELEAPLDRIKSLASTACMIVEYQLGRDGPASELTVLLSLIEETARSAEDRRLEVWGLMGGRPD